MSTKKRDVEQEFQDLRAAVLAAALTDVPFDGWTETTLMNAAAAAGFERDEALRAFPGGRREAVECYLRMADERMLAKLADVDPATLKIRERITLAVRTRLEAAEGERDVILRTLSLLATPAYSKVATRSLYETVNTIWYWAGDTATDFNFYTKRGLLAGVYTSTLLFWLNDDSPDHAETWAFLDRRIADVMRIPQVTQRFKKIRQRLPNLGPLLGKLRRRRATG